MKKYYIALQLMGISNDIIIKIMEVLSYKQLVNIFDNGNILEIEFKYNIHLGKYIQKFDDKIFLKNALNKAENIIKKNKVLGIKTIIFISKNYPRRLKLIKNPPAILYIKGRNILKEDDKSIACIGTRNPTNYGIKTTKSVISNLVREKFTIISGLAYGIDSISHESCLNNNGRTIAVLAHGLDIIYPKDHTKLAEEIVQSGGTLISEYPVGTKVDKFRFVHRNRIVSGLAAGVLMIEAKEKSGTRYTIDFAIEQNKKIFVPVFNKFSFESGLNLELLNSKKAIAINGDDDYVKILKQLDYKLKYDKRLINKLKSKQINLLINELLKETNIDVNEFKENDGKVSFDVNKETYSMFKQILKEEDITIKQFFNSIILGVLNKRGEK
ncbi:DNA processing protein [Clostridium moniliforme]|uniref:DNA processing protein n=1 Tax=Clostridium moniliforme TaxID=39489 RepID=A0ABS4F0V6_9CLOT|nr:DNA-processing protein DprA [Clostridium moniliforme]MBP1889882.1 DNA processing protein [Clostridium moniliforme]